MDWVEKVFFFIKRCFYCYDCMVKFLVGLNCVKFGYFVIYEVDLSLFLVFWKLNVCVIWFDRVVFRLIKWVRKLVSLFVCFFIFGFVWIKESSVFVFFKYVGWNWYWFFKCMICVVMFLI